MRRLINTQSKLANELADQTTMNHTRERYYSTKQNTKKFHDQGKVREPTFSERDNEISKQNAILIKNLLEISHGKRVSFNSYDNDDNIRLLYH